MTWVGKTSFAPAVIVLAVMVLAGGPRFTPATAAEISSSVPFAGGLKLISGPHVQEDLDGGTGSTGSPSSLTMKFSLPDDPGTQFMFSPRLAAIAPDISIPNEGTRGYLGFSLGVDSSTGLYGSLDLGSSVLTDRTPGLADPTRGIGAAPLLLHGGLELGYRLTGHQNLSVTVDRAASPDGADHNSAVGAFRLHYGLNF